MTLLQIASLTKRFGALTALQDVSLATEAGTIHGLIGPNGSGKSTLMKCIVGDVEPTSGEILFEEKPISQQSTTERARRGIGVKFQITSVFETLSVYDNILLAAQSHARLATLALSRSRGALADEIEDLLDQFKLWERRDEQAADLSHGEQQWLEIAMALARRPRLLLLDEPTAGMSLPERAHTGALLRSLISSCAIVIVEHDLSFIRDISDRLTVLDRGRVVKSGTVGEVQDSSEVKEVYLTRV
ncbi:ABC transporter ATP-binding protein [Chelatococcus asaccharovorans]|uniref:ABC transporter ATP-binding protein n=1 Tax=Chelatococcus asaccharovorans TaxID=28210 RepID=UPI00224C7042|nr:ABC transporter ATP-binding protein [Chelatococcus asaccharovorans]CAH1659666.1 Urea ABC transporter, ATPase protein UrtD [Chelatococcus asaccharovorans]CAH1684107.1 Urea ABC transporter, ATPase protein UrtD [Chelatococcus asaccharovorans]